MALEKAPESMATGYFHSETSPQLLCLQGLGGRGAEHHLSSLGAAALRTSFQPELLPTSTGRGEQGSVVPPLSSRTKRSSWRPRRWGERRLALHACGRVSDGCGKRRQRGSNEKMEGRETEGLGKGEAPPFFSLLFLGIWKLLLTGLSGSSGPLGRAAAPASEESWGCSWLKLGAASAAAVSSGPAPPPGSAMLRPPPPFCGEDSSSGSAWFISSSPPPPPSQLAFVGGEASVSAAVAIAPAWGARGSICRQGRRGWGEGAAGRPRRRAALSPPTPFPPWPPFALPTQEPLGGPKAGAPTVPPGPKSRSSLGQFFGRPPPLNVLASGPGGGGPSQAAPPMGARRPPPRVRIARAGGRSFGAPEPAKRGNRNAQRVSRRCRPASGWLGLEASCKLSDRSGQRSRRGGRGRPGPGSAGVAYLGARLLSGLRARVTSAKTGFEQWMRDDPGFVKYLRACKGLKRRWDKRLQW